MKLSISLFFLFVSCFISNAQILNPVHWTTETKKVSDKEYELIFKAKLDKGWAIYSQSSDPEAASPTEVSFTKASHFEVIGKTEEVGKKKEGPEPLFENKIVSKYYDHVDFVQKIKVSDLSKPIRASVYYMSCDSEQCIPPTPKDFVFNLGSSTASTDVALEVNKPISINMNDQAGSNAIFDPVKVQARIKKISETSYQVEFDVKIDQDWFIYSNKIGDEGPIPTSIGWEAGSTYKINGELIETSDHQIKGFDEIFEMELIKYKDQVVFAQNIDITDLSIPVKGMFTYQTCDASKCLPPKSLGFEIDPKNVKIMLEGAGTSTGALIDGNNIDQTIPTIASTLANPAGNCGEERVRGTNYLWTLLFGFLGGLLALLTPCVFPMIPLTVSFFTKGSKDRKSGVKNGLIYGLSIIVIYVAIGLLITAAFGATALNELSTNWVANVLFFIIFVIFAFSFFGYFEITLPSSWSNKTDSMADKGGLIGTFFMAFTLAIVSFSCTGPIIGSAIVESAKDPVGPAIVMFGFSLALALPFGLFAAFPAWLNSLPKSGSWMSSVKVVLGFLELALALKFLSVADMTKHWGILGYEIFMGLWVLIFALMTIYLFGFIKFPHDSPVKKLGPVRWVFALGALFLTFYLGSGFRFVPEYGSYHSLSMMSGLAPPSTYNYFLPDPVINADIKLKYPSFTKCANNIDCFKDYHEGLAYAKETGKPLFVDFTGYGCVNCRKTEEHIWVNDKIRKKLNEDFVLVSLYVDDRAPLDSQLVSSVTKSPIRNVGNKWADFQIVNFNQNSQPLYVMMSPDEKVLAKPRGYREGVESYNQFLDCGLEAYRNESSKVGAH
ncbi:MAG: thioredoxin family protein [Saprospiraceae bacterium]|nr:thioredoxin family protein [Candidatus Vicinibacter affinis]